MRFLYIKMALQLIKSFGEETRLGIWKIDETNEDLLSRLQLSEIEKIYYQTLIHQKRNSHWLGSRVLLRFMMKTNDFIWLDKDEWNKPVLKNFPEHVSISHSNDMAAVMLSKSYPVGVDIEKIRTKVLLIKNRFLSLLELDFINKSAEINHLYACWCIKEAVYKWYGKKGVSFRDDILILPFNLKEEGFAEFKINRDDFNETRMANYFVFQDYMIAWVESRL